jgi:hypothetical protein
MASRHHVLYPSVNAYFSAHHLPHRRLQLRRQNHPRKRISSARGEISAFYDPQKTAELRRRGLPTIIWKGSKVHEVPA